MAPFSQIVEPPRNPGRFSGAFGYLLSKEPVLLRARIQPHVAWLLSETPLSDEQSLTQLADTDWQLLEAWVPDDQQTLWWLKALGASVEVLEPLAWREEILADAKRVLEWASQQRAVSSA